MRLTVRTSIMQHDPSRTIRRRSIADPSRPMTSPGPNVSTLLAAASAARYRSACSQAITVKLQRGLNCGLRYRVLCDVKGLASARLQAALSCNDTMATKSATLDSSGARGCRRHQSSQCTWGSDESRGTVLSPSSAASTSVRASSSPLRRSRDGLLFAALCTTWPALRSDLLCDVGSARPGC